MMQRQQKTSALALILALSVVPIGSVALAHGEVGDHADNPAEHMATYEQEIADLVGAADSIAADYAEDETVADRVDALVAEWEQVDFHEAVETNAMALYPPIWVALGNLRSAVDQDAADAEVHQSQQQLAAALHEGLGALKLAAAQGDAAADTADTTGQSAAADDRPTIAIIQDNLQQARDQYRDGEVKAAQKLVYDTYMQRFEGIEGDLIEQDADLVTGLEADFNATLPQLMENDASVDEVRTQVEAMNKKLDTAQKLLDKAEQEQSEVF